MRALKQELCQPHRKPPLADRRVSRASVRLPHSGRCLLPQPRSPHGDLAPSCHPVPDGELTPTSQLVPLLGRPVGFGPGVAQRIRQGWRYREECPRALPRPRRVWAEPASGWVPALLLSCPTPPGSLWLLSPDHDEARKAGGTVSTFPPHAPQTQVLGRDAGGGGVDTTWGSPFSPLGRRIPAAQGSAQNRRTEGAVEGLAAWQAPSGCPAPPRLECQPLCPAEVPQESGHRCRGLVAGIPSRVCRFQPGASVSCVSVPAPVALQPLGLRSCLPGPPLLALRPVLVTPPPPAQPPLPGPCWGGQPAASMPSTAPDSVSSPQEDRSLGFPGA